MAQLRIITTSDGSHSLLNENLNETYHSIHGAIQESLHVFIQRGLEFYINAARPGSLSVLEVGFGTGLNALLTLCHVNNTATAIRYTALEPFPIAEEVWSSLNYTGTTGMDTSFQLMHRSEWGSAVEIAEGFELNKVKDSLQEVALQPGAFDLVYFDAFAPSKQPEIWSFPMLRKVVEAMKSNAVFVTYCAKGQLKRDLKALGLSVETLQGPPGKHEMVRATKLSPILPNSR